MLSAEVVVCCTLLLCAVPRVEAASWQWSPQPGRERVEVRFDRPANNVSASRTGTTELTIQLDGPAVNFAGSGAGALVRGVSAEGNTLRIALRDPAFGYVVSRPTSTTMRVDVFADALGTRWKGRDTSTATPPQQTVPPAATPTQTVPPAATPTRPATPSAVQNPARTPQNGTALLSPTAAAGLVTPPVVSASPLSQALAPTATPTPTTTLGTPLPQSPAAGTRGVPPGEFVPLGPATPPPAGASSVQSAPAQNATNRVDPRTVGRAPLSDGRNVMAGPVNATRAQTAAPADAPEATQPLDIPKDPEVPLPSTNDLSRITGRIESAGVGEPRPVNALGAVAGHLNSDLSAPNAAVPAQEAAAFAQPAAPTPVPVASPAPVSPPVPAPVPVPAPGVVVEATPPPAPANPGTAFRGRMMRPSEESEPVVAAPATPPAAPAIPVAPVAPATSAVPVAPAISAAPTTPIAPEQPVNAPRQSLRQSLNAEAATDPATSGTTAIAPKSGTTALPTEQIPPIVPANSVVQHTTTTAAPAVVGGQSATEAAMPPTSPVEETPEGEQRQMLGGSGVLGKNTKPDEEDPNIIYVDEKGNVVSKPPDIPTMMKDVQQQMNNLQFQTALDLLLPLKDMVLPPETREQVLYSISECLNNIHKDNPLTGYEPITKATSEAMNYNLNSERVPEALYRLGMLNLGVGNQQDAAGYFGAMRSRYPHRDTVPYGYFALGQDQLKNKQYAEAVRSFQTVMDEYPESKAVRDAARGMAEALYRQGHYDRAQILVDFVDRRWPRIYLDDSTYLPMVGEIQTRMQDYDNALQTYWTSYNLTPDSPDNHKTLLQIGAIYLQSGFDKGARHVFAELLRKYPQSESAPKAVLLMAEQGFAKDNPTLDEMFTIFGRPGDMPVEAAYRRLMNDYPDSPEALQAELRDAALSYWNGDTDEAMAKAQAFMNKHPGTPESERAKEIIMRGFTRALELAKQEENNERILSLWERYPVIQTGYPNPDDDLRVAMARAKLNRGDEASGLLELATFLDKPEGKYSDYVYNLFLAKHLQDSNWNGILELGEKVKDWKLPTDVRNQLDYSRAISAENLGMKARSLPIWDRLYKLPDGELPLYQKAYATYFMAREAENRRDLKDAYDLNARTLDLFTQLEEERSDKADPERVRESLAGLMDVTEVAGRFAEALEWAGRYSTFVPQDSPDYAGLLFRQARLHRKMGDMARWRSLLDTIVQREPESVFGRMAASEMRTQEVSRNLTRFTEQPKPAGTSSSASDNTPTPQTGAQGAQPAGQ